jgi:hypothetical protein
MFALNLLNIIHLLARGRGLAADARLLRNHGLARWHHGITQGLTQLGKLAPQQCPFSSKID